MNKIQKSQNCPRCRFPLSKSIRQKIICKKCGYTSNKLQIVAQQDGYDGYIHFSKKVHMKKQKEQIEVKNQNFLQLYLKHFQQILRQLGKSFIDKIPVGNLIERQRILENFKNLWFQYLEVMSKQGNSINGIFTHIINKADKQTQNQKKPQKQQESDDSNSQNEQEKQKNNNLQKDETIKGNRKIQQSQQQQYKLQQKKPQSKDQALTQFKRIFNQVIKQFKIQPQLRTRQNNKQCPEKFIQKLLLIEEQKISDSSFSSITYLTQKYAFVLSLYLNDKKKTKQSKFDDNKLLNSYVKSEDLKILCANRNLTYQKRKLCTQLSLMSNDLLHFIYKKSRKNQTHYFDQNQNLPYPYLLQFYQNKCRKVPIVQRISQLLQKMSEQAVIKMEDNQKKAPQLSLKFICSLIYLTCLSNRHCFTISQVLSHIKKSFDEHFKQNILTQIEEKRHILILMKKQRNLKVRRIKKLSHQLIKYVQNSFIHKEPFVNKWCQKYSTLFGLPLKYKKQYSLLTETLVNGYMQQLQTKGHISFNNSFSLVNGYSKRYIIIQQAEISLSSLVIYFKLKFGLDRGQYPYLKNVSEVYETLKENQKYLKDNQVENFKFLQNLISRNKQVFSDIKQRHLSMKHLLKRVIQTSQSIKMSDNLKSICNNSVRDMTQMIEGFNNIFDKKIQKSLTLMYNLNIKIYGEPETKEKLIEVEFIKQRSTSSIADIFRNKKLKKVIQLKESFIKQLNYINEKQKSIEGIEKVSQKVVPNRIKSQTVLQNDQIQDFKLEEHLDRPQNHYEIIYHPTINTLNQLGLNQLLLLVQSLSFHLNGQFSDCKDVLEWLGFLQSILINFQD